MQDSRRKWITRLAAVAFPVYVLLLVVVVAASARPGRPPWVVWAIAGLLWSTRV
jgi:hypothetical protein